METQGGKCLKAGAVGQAVPDSVTLASVGLGTNLLFSTNVLFLGMNLTGANLRGDQDMDDSGWVLTTNQYDEGLKSQQVTDIGQILYASGEGVWFNYSV